MPQPSALYRQVIDRLVHECREGQGQIGSQRAQQGTWNVSARPDFIPEQHAINELLARMTAEDREILAGMLRDQFVGGVHAALVVLHEEEVQPFEDGYEGTPFHDFIGRLNDWPWPE